jgi:hypothetical protein
MAMAAKTQGHTAFKAASEKETKYKSDCTARDMNFVALPAEAQGLLHPSFHGLIRRLEKRCVGSEGIPELTTWSAQSFRQYWLQRISIALQTSNAKILSGNFNILRGVGNFDISSSSHLVSSHLSYPTGAAFSFAG